MFDPEIRTAAEAALAACRARGWTLATAESCTGGLIAGALTAISGSSDVVSGGFVTYANAAKRDLLGVSEALLATHGAVSEPVAKAMAEGARARTRAQIAVAATGIAGPSGGTASKPVGTVHVGLAVAGRDTAHRHLVLVGDRDAVRRQTVLAALNMIREAAQAER